MRESLSDDRLSEADAEIIANNCFDNTLCRKAVGFGEQCLFSGAASFGVEGYN